MKLYEGALFGANELKTVQKIYHNSTVNKINCSDEEMNLVKRIVNKISPSVSIDIEKNANTVYNCLYAASYGSETRSNSLLRYLQALGEKNPRVLIDKVSYVTLVLNNVASNNLTVGEDVDAYMLNSSLYARNNLDFTYTVKAFDAVIYKKNKYFNLNSNNTVSVSIQEPLISVFFENNTGDYYAGDEDDIASTYAENIVNSDVPLDQKFLFRNKSVSTDDTIIPAGVNGTNTSERTIWNYMEIWSNDVKSNKVKDNAENKQKNSERMKDNVKDFIKNKNDAWTDKEKQALIDYIDDNA